MDFEYIPDGDVLCRTPRLQCEHSLNAHHDLLGNGDELYGYDGSGDRNNVLVCSGSSFPERGSRERSGVSYDVATLSLSVGRTATEALHKVNDGRIRKVGGHSVR